MKTWLVVLLNTGYFNQSQGLVSMQVSSFGKCENEPDEIRKGIYLALQQETGARCLEVTWEKEILNDNCLSFVAHKHSLSGGDRWGKNNMFLYTLKA